MKNMKQQWITAEQNGMKPRDKILSILLRRLAGVVGFHEKH